MNEKFSEIEVPEIKLPELHGHTKIELTDVITGEVEVIEKDNIVTDAVKGFLEYLIKLQNRDFISYTYTPSGGGETSSFDWRQIAKLISGLFIFNNTLIENTSNVYIPDPATAKMIGYAGNITSDGYDTCRGDYNISESGVLANGYKFVWDFGTDDANGTVASVCLTNPIAGYHGYHRHPGSELYNSNTGEYKSNKATRYMGCGKQFAYIGSGSPSWYAQYFTRYFTDIWSSHGICHIWKEDGDVMMESLFPLSTNYYYAAGAVDNSYYTWVYRKYRLSTKTLFLKGSAKTMETLVDTRPVSTPFELWNGYNEAEQSSGYNNYRKTMNFTRPQCHIFDMGDKFLHVIRSNYPLSTQSLDYRDYRSMESATIFYRFLDKTTLAPISGSERCVEFPYTIVSTSNYHGDYRFIVRQDYTTFCDDPVYYRDGKIYVFPRKYNTNDRLCSVFKIDVATGAYTMLADDVVCWVGSTSSARKRITFMSENKTIFWGGIVIDRNDVVHTDFFSDVTDDNGMLLHRQADSYNSYGNNWSEGGYEIFPLDIGVTLNSGRGIVDSYGYNCDIFPNIWYLATINNLPEPIQKTPSKTMKVTYTITEANS